jgi:hypothetical protein
MFSWRGSAGATGYDIERAAAPEGPWAVLAEDVSDADVAYRPLFSDDTAESGDIWCYRVKARNAGGTSEASNVIGPVAIKEVCTVDECIDLSRVSVKSGELSLDNTYNARFAERMFRIKGEADDYLIYQVKGSVNKVRVTAFFQAPQGPVKDLHFGVSKDGRKFDDAGLAERQETAYPSPPHADQKYRQTQVDYLLRPPDGMYYLKVGWSAPAALDRVEIFHTGK